MGNEPDVSAKKNKTIQKTPSEISLEGLIEDFQFPLRKCQRSWAAESASLGPSPPASSPAAQDGDLLPWTLLRIRRGSAEECVAQLLAFRRS